MTRAAQASVLVDELLATRRLTSSEARAIAEGLLQDPAPNRTLIVSVRSARIALDRFAEWLPVICLYGLFLAWAFNR